MPDHVTKTKTNVGDWEDKNKKQTHGRRTPVAAALKKHTRWCKEAEEGWGRAEKMGNINIVRFSRQFPGFFIRKFFLLFIANTRFGNV